MGARDLRPQSGALFLVLKAECIAVCALMWHGTQWVYHQPLHLIRSVQGLLPSSPGANPSPSCLSLVRRFGYPGNTHGRGIPFPNYLLVFNRLGCPGNMLGKGILFLNCLLLFSRLGCLSSTPGRGIPFPDCLLLISRLGCPGSTLGKGIPFLDCLLLFSRLGCLSSTPGRGIPFPDCLLLFNRLGCPSSTLGRGIPFPDCLLLFSRLGCPGSTPGRGISFPDCLLLFNTLHCTQSPGTVTHLSHTQYVCEVPPDNPLLLLASCIAATHINSFSLSFLPSFFPYCIATTNNINSSWQPITRCLILDLLLITYLIFWFLSKSYR